MEIHEHDGPPIAFTRSGRGDPVVLLHNGGMSHVIWRDVLPVLALRHEVFALDLIGFGGSGRPVAPVTLDDHVAAVADFLDHHDLAPAALVGNCMGSAIALALARRRPDAVSALVLINLLTEGTLLAGRLGMARRLRRSLPTFSQPVFAMLRRLRVPHVATRSLLRLELGPLGRAAGLDRDPELRACATAPGELRPLLGVLDDLARYGAEPVAPPVTLIWGAANQVLSPDAGRRLVERLRPVRTAWLDGCGHLPMLEAPELVATLIEESLELAHPEPHVRAAR